MIVFTACDFCKVVQSIYAPSIPFNAQVSKVVLFSMRDAVIHLSWLVTHFVRSFWEENRATRLITHLSSEVGTLQAEIHRTEQILKGYGTLLERCESQHRTQNTGNAIFLVIFCVILLSLLINRFVRPRRPAVSVVADTGGSSDSDENGPIALQTQPNVKGPQRPSTFGRGKQR